MRRLLLVLALVALPRDGLAQSFDLGARQWGLGLQVGLLDVPRGHIGIPTAGDQSAVHLPAVIVVRWRMTDRMAITGGVGIPQSGLGLSFCLGHELFARLATSPRRIVGLDLYENAGLQLGFVGPDYFARHENEFAGYAYTYSGPLAFGLRLPVGLRATWLDGVFDTYVESLPLLMLRPSVEALFDLSLGLRFRL